jgi:hypothetical protein
MMHISFLSSLFLIYFYSLGHYLFAMFYCEHYGHEGNKAIDRIPGGQQ